MIEKDEIELWISRKGKFCIVDYKSPDGTKTAMGKLIDVLHDKLIIKNLNNGEEQDVLISNIENSKVKDIRVGNNE